jgi:hypothetical protein
MKKHVLFLFIGLATFTGYFLPVRGSQDIFEQDDFSIVHAMQNYSNITRSYVNSWRRYFLSFLSEAGEPVTIAAGAYAAYKANQKAAELNSTYAETLRKNVLQNALFPAIMQAPDSITTFMTNENAWRFAGAAGVALVSYRSAYQYVAGQVLQKVKDLEYLCQQLFVATRQFSSVMELKKALSNADEEDNYNPVWQAGTVIALKNGLLDLKNQTTNALLLLVSLKSKDRSLRKNIQRYQDTLESNLDMVKGSAELKRELQ